MSHPNRIANVKGEKIVPEFNFISYFSFFPDIVKGLAAKMYKLLGQKRYHDLMSLSQPMNTFEYL